MTPLLMLGTPAPDPALLDALKTEMARSEALQLDDAPPLYSLRYHVALLDQFSMVTSFGSLQRRERTPFHGLGVEVRVGTPAFDNTGFGGWEDGFSATGLADDLTPLSLRQSTWALTDRAYKQAVEQHARKSAQFTAPPDYPGDYTEMGPVLSDAGWGTPTDVGVVEELALALSETFASVGDRLLAGQVHVGAENGGVSMMGTDGSRLSKPLQEVTVRALAQLRTEDGETLSDQRLWSVQTPAQLPGREQMLEEVATLRDDLIARASAPPLSEEYVGPVIFEDGAARDLFRYVLTGQLEGTPAPIPYDSWFGEMGERKETVRVGRRVLPDGWTVVDDPQSRPEHPSTYSHDWEGVPAERVELVEDGIVRELLMSRTPREGLEPNGHARGFLGSRAQGRVTQVEVLAPKQKSQRKLRKKALQMARSYGRDHVFVIRRLQEDHVRAVGSSASFFGMGDDGPRLPPPVEVVKLSSDGTETVLRGARFASVQRFVLRDIALAGPQTDGTYLAPRDGDTLTLGMTEGMPTWITAPDVLVREVELVPTSGDPRDTPVLLPPTP